MKKLVILSTIFLLTLGTAVFAQAPSAFSYQAVARDQSGTVLADQKVSLRITLYTPSDSTAREYVETHAVTTNAYGLLDIEIGRGHAQEGHFDALDWGLGSYFIKVDMEEKGGTDYHEMGMSQLLSVPYALYAEHTKLTMDKDDSSTDELQVLSLSSDTLYLSKGGFVILPKDTLRSDTIWKRNNKDIFFSDGRVGIGVVTPESQLQIVDDASKDNGKSRQFVFLKNTSNASSAHTAVTIHSGTDNNFNNGSFGVTPNSYNLIQGYGGYSYLMGSNNGLLLRARDVTGHIRFMTGGEGDQYERLRISHDGNVGIGTSDPTSKLQVNDGDIFIEDIDRGIIMKSPNGKCWRVTVDDSGGGVTTEVDCR